MKVLSAALCAMVLAAPDANAGIKPTYKQAVQACKEQKQHLVKTPGKKKVAKIQYKYCHRIVAYSIKNPAGAQRRWAKQELGYKLKKCKTDLLREESTCRKISWWRKRKERAKCFKELYRRGAKLRYDFCKRQAKEWHQKSSAKDWVLQNKLDIEKLFDRFPQKPAPCSKKCLGKAFIPFAGPKLFENCMKKCGPSYWGRCEEKCKKKLYIPIVGPKAFANCVRRCR